MNRVNSRSDHGREDSTINIVISIGIGIININSSALVAISKGKKAVKLCSNEIIQLLTEGTGYHMLNNILIIKRLYNKLSYG